MRIQKRIAVILGAVLLLASLGTAGAIADADRLSVVTTIFPIYDWVREIAGKEENADITLLLDSGVDLHSYQPTAADIMRIATCDAFIYVGGESDEWVEDALQEAVNPDMVVVNLLDCLGDDVKIEEIVEGMEHEHDHDEEEEEHHEDEHEGEREEDHDHEHEEEADEHIWLSLRNAQKLVSAIATKLAEADPAHAEGYRANAATYCEALSALDAKYAETAEKAVYKTVLFGDRFPFRYLTDDYGLAYYAAFSGCSAETEASFQTIVFLAQKVNELGLPAVLTIEGTSHKIAETIIQTTADKNQKLLTLDSMQGVTATDVQAGASYLAIMEANLNTLKDALE
ncbi:MAG: metal ABC transporter substrate-binding protein [Clostridiales bacterium]|nr:metal ABC transporter substrate-binding protein [Clostridiales bacterium]